MKKLFIFLAALLALISVSYVYAISIFPALGNGNAEKTDFGKYLNYEKTLRLDYIFSGDAKGTEISLAKMGKLDGWWGRRVNMDAVPLRGNGQITLRDSATNKVLYKVPFSTLFSEWLSTPEAATTRKSFENVFLVPMPKSTAFVTVTLFGRNELVTCEMTHKVDPKDILIRPVKSSYTVDKCKYTHKGGESKDAIDIAIVGEGYTAEEMESFFKHAKETSDEILRYEPFKSMANSLNFIAVPVESKESGVSIPLKNEWKETAFSSHFSTFYMDRYLTTLHLFDLHDALASVPYEHIIILANTENYGGGGIFNSYVLTAARNPWAMPVVVHEFGHSFGGLADEYFYDDGTDQYDLNVEPWEPNITTLISFKTKWQDMITPVKHKFSGKHSRRFVYFDEGRHLGAWTVTKYDQQDEEFKNMPASDYKVGIYEGGGYLSQGIYRPFPTCRMRDNTYPDFCPVCRRALERMITFNTIPQK